MFAGKFKGDVDPEEGLHPSNCRNPREWRVLEFLMHILNPKKPKRSTLTMANTLFGAMFGVRPMNWGLLIHEVVGRAIPHIRRKPFNLSTFILHLSKHFDCINVDEEDMLTIASDEVACNLHPAVVDTETSSDRIIPERLVLRHHGRKEQGTRRTRLPLL